MPPTHLFAHVRRQLEARGKVLLPHVGCEGDVGRGQATFEGEVNQNRVVPPAGPGIAHAVRDVLVDVVHAALECARTGAVTDRPDGILLAHDFLLQVVPPGDVPSLRRLRLAVLARRPPCCPTRLGEPPATVAHGVVQPADQRDHGAVGPRRRRRRRGVGMAGHHLAGASAPAAALGDPAAEGGGRVVLGRVGAAPHSVRAVGGGLALPEVERRSGHCRRPRAPRLLPPHARPCHRGVQVGLCAVPVCSRAIGPAQQLQQGELQPGARPGFDHHPRTIPVQALGQRKGRRQELCQDRGALASRTTCALARGGRDSRHHGGWPTRGALPGVGGRGGWQRCATRKTPRSPSKPAVRARAGRGVAVRFRATCFGEKLGTHVPHRSAAADPHQVASVWVPQPSAHPSPTVATW